MKNLIGLMTFCVVGMMAVFSEAQTTSRISVNLQGGDPIGNGFEGSGNSEHPAISTDGRFVAFDSGAINLAIGDGNDLRDVFVFDRQTQTTSRVSVNHEGKDPDGDSGHPAISADGRFVAFESEATNLVVGDENGLRDIFVYDRETDTMTRVSVAIQGGDSNGHSFFSSISGDGRFIAFESGANNLVIGDENEDWDIFVYDRQTATTTRVSVDKDGDDPNGQSVVPAISSNGRFVAFQSGASNLVPDDGSTLTDIFVYDRQTETTTRASVDSQGRESNGQNLFPSISGDGRFVAFQSGATNLVEGDANDSLDIFIHDRQTATTTRVSLNTQGDDTNNHSRHPAISDDGRFVTFASGATNLVLGDTNNRQDIFVKDRQMEISTRLSVDGDGNESNGDSFFPAISGIGRFVVFQSFASNLVPEDGNGLQDIFVRGQGQRGLQEPGRPDLNGDGKDDVVWRNTNSGGVAVWLMNGTTIQASGTLGNVPNEWHIQGIGDVDGDGMADLTWKHGSLGMVAVWLMDGMTLDAVDFPGGVAPEWEIEQVGDVNGDGRADILWRSSSSGVVAVWLMNGASISSVAFLGGVPAEWEIVGMGDVDGDNKADVIWSNSMSGTVATWLMEGEIIESVEIIGPAPPNQTIHEISDMDGDGKADIIWRDNIGEVAIWLLNGTTITSSGSPGGLPLEWEIAQAGDVDADGKADIIWHNRHTGEIFVWLMNGTTITTTGSPGGLSTDWKIQ